MTTQPTAPIEILTTASAPEWQEVLRVCPDHDFHHRPEYHAHAEAHGEGLAHLLVFRDSGYTIAVPLLLRPLAGLQGLGESARALCDATSVYGYAGPIASHRTIPDAVLRRFGAELETTLRDLHVVTVFSRLHPLFEQRQYLAHCGDAVATGRTVSLDLTRPVDEQYAGFRKSHRRGLKKLRELGLRVAVDADLKHLDEFVEIYTASMRRVGASPQYYFGREYFETLARGLGPAMRLFLVLHGSTVVAATLHSAYNGIVQAHLGGTADHALEWSPDKLLIDEVRLWACANGYRVFHHGGGVGAQEDKLYLFKAGFSDKAHDFWTWRWVVDPAAHAKLCAERAAWNASHGLTPAAETFFPAYRAPAAPVEPPPGVFPHRGTTSAGLVFAHSAVECLSRELSALPLL